MLGTIIKKWRDCSDRNYFKNQIKWIQVFGMHPIDYSTILPQLFGFLSRPLNILYMAFAQFLALHIAILHFMTIMAKTSEGTTLDQISGIIMTGIIYFFSFFITVFFQWRSKDIANLFDCFNKEMLRRSVPGVTYFRIEHSYWQAKSQINVWLVLCIAGTLHWSITPLFGDHRTLPLGCDYPFDAFVSPRYEIIYFTQFLGQTQVAVTFGTSSGVFMSMITMICGQFDILFCSLKNLHYFAMIRTGDVETVK